jgi:hypothetical protein
MKRTFLLLFLVTVNLSAQTASEKLKEDASLTFFCPFEDSVNSEKTVTEPKGGPIGKVVGKSEYTQGVVGKAIDMPEGLKSFIQYPARDSVDLKKGTMMFWFKPHWEKNLENPRRSLFWVRMKDPSQSVFFALYRSFSEKAPQNLFICLGWDSGTEVDSGRIFRKDQWTHLALTWNTERNIAVFYVNGNKNKSLEWKDVTADERYRPEFLLLGRYYPSDEPIDAAYDEFYLMKRDLDFEEVEKYYEETMGGAQ